MYLLVNVKRYSPCILKNFLDADGNYHSFCPKLESGKDYWIFLEYCFWPTSTL